MNDPYANDLEEGDLTADSAVRPEPRTLARGAEPEVAVESADKSERVRTFTPDASSRQNPRNPFRRVVSRESGPVEDLESLESDLGESLTPMTWDTGGGATNLARTSGHLLPALQRNKTYDFLESVHHRTNPEALENNVVKAFRLSALVLLVGVVVTVLGAIFVFRGDRPKGPPQPENPVRRVVQEEPINVPSVTAEAVAALEGFLASTAPEDRQKLIGSDEPLPLALAAQGGVPALEKSRLTSGGAQVVRVGRQVAVLVPMTDPAGVSRTAAVLQRQGKLLVDWRSVLTPESMPWRDFVTAPSDEPRLFRLELQPSTSTGQSSGAFAARRPAGEPSAVTVEVDPRSRVSEELGAAFETRRGGPLAADFYLQGKAGGLLRIVGWVPDKWALR